MRLYLSVVMLALNLACTVFGVREGSDGITCAGSIGVIGSMLWMTQEIARRWMQNSDMGKAQERPKV